MFEKYFILWTDEWRVWWRLRLYNKGNIEFFWATDERKKLFFCLHSFETLTVTDDDDIIKAEEFNLINWFKGVRNWGAKRVKRDPSQSSHVHEFIACESSFVSESKSTYCEHWNFPVSMNFIRDSESEKFIVLQPRFTMRKNKTSLPTSFFFCSKMMKAEENENEKILWTSDSEG